MKLRITIDLYRKPMCGHQYLHYDSWHAEPVKNLNVNLYQIKSNTSIKKNMLREGWPWFAH